MSARETRPRTPALKSIRDEAAGTEQSGVRPRQSEPPSADLIPPTLEPEIFGLSESGLVRPSNQDQFAIIELTRKMSVLQGSLPAHSGEVESLQGRLLVVADGMGGYEGGDLASAIAVDTFANFVVELMPWTVATTGELGEHVLDTLRMGVHAADVSVHRAATELGLDERMGTTLTAVYVAWPDAYLVHVGDSRCYLRRGEKVARLTTDHTVAQELLDLHAIDNEQASRTQLRHVLVNTVGGVREKQLMVEVESFSLGEGDELLLCTDGLTGFIDDEELPDLLTTGGSVEQRARLLVDLVYQRGAGDNVTAVLARF